MQSTKIIRRLDDLGRVVIPKSMRKNLKIRAGDNLEIFVTEDGLTLKKYSPFTAYLEVAVSVAKSLKSTLNRTIVITDKDGLIYSTDKTLTAQVKYDDAISGGKVVVKNGDGLTENLLYSKAIVADEVIGYIAIIGDKDLSDGDIKSVKFSAEFLADFYGFGDKN